MERALGFKICFCKVFGICLWNNYYTYASARIVERVTVGSTSACRTILRSSLLVVFLVAPDPVFRAWVPSSVHCSQQFLRHTPSDPPGESNTARRPACRFHPDNQASLKLA
ncbi:hypothetical protein TNCV_2508641 [Trichonephila clavipes]|nr:hypothetical protein TNCV_2508641 [Trichonephila clavipes]